MTKRIEELEKETFEKDDSPELPPSDIVAYNELRSCADLFRMHTQGILEVQPRFEREVVWKKADKTRFIDSLVKQLPIPSMCLSLDYKKQRWQIIDGLQRMSSIIGFLSGDMGKLSTLDDIDPKLSGQSIEQLMDERSDIHHFFTRVENLTLPITVLRCDYSKDNHMEYLFKIFHRLNTGGMRLNNQEIRNCIYSGPFNELLKELDDNKKWRKINKMKPGHSYRFSKQELILRYFAFHDDYKQYTGRLARFLNEYMRNNRYVEGNKIRTMTELFEATIDIVYKKVYRGIIPVKLSITLLEALLFGVSFNIRYLESQTLQVIKDLYRKLNNHNEFTEQKLSEGLSKKARVTARLKAAKTIFSGK